MKKKQQSQEAFTSTPVLNISSQQDTEQTWGPGKEHSRPEQSDKPATDYPYLTYEQAPKYPLKKPTIFDQFSIV